NMTDPTITQTSSITGATAEKLIHDLVAIPSPSTQEAAAVEHLVNWMQSHGYDEAFIDDAGNTVGIIGNGAQDILLLGHIDTFGGFPEVRLENRTLYGRGSVDAKGSLATFAVAAARANLNPDLRLIVVGAVEEEAASSKGARYIATQYNPTACFIGEPSAWDRITLGYKGRLLLHWRWHGALAHSANQIATPAEHAFAYWQRIRAYCDEFNADETRIFATLDPTLQDIASGQEGAYGWAEMTIGFRIPPGINPTDLVSDFAPTEGATVRAYGIEQAYIGDKNSNISRVMRGAIRAEGGKPRFVHKTGTSDMNVVAHHWDCPMLAYGPGDSALDHTPDEHLNLDEYLQAIRILTGALERL
ncbi:MAG: [LysW]-lysine hydrolase, partial [Aggregatilineales bacterium]